MYVERVTPGRAFGPTSGSEVLAAHDRTETLEEDLDDAGLDRGERGPQSAVADHTVFVERGERGLLVVAPTRQRGQPGLHFCLVSRDAHPVLEHVDDFWWAGAGLYEEQTRRSRSGETLPSVFFTGPANEDDIHDTVDRTDDVLHQCFVPMKRTGLLGLPRRVRKLPPRRLVLCTKRYAHGAFSCRQGQHATGNGSPTH